MNIKAQNFYNQAYDIYVYNYLSDKNKQNCRINFIIGACVVGVIALSLVISKPIFAFNNSPQIKNDTGQKEIYLQKNFEENIKNKYSGAYVAFPTDGIAHIKLVKYINSRPIKINVVELNTNVNPNLQIKPAMAGNTLNSKSTVRKIANQKGSIVAINGGFFKPQTGVPLGALVIDGKILTGPIYNRVGIAIFEEDNKTYYKMDNIVFDIKAHTKNHTIKIDNINQPRMLASNTLLYTSIWGKVSPIAPKGGYNVLVSGNIIKKISANPIEISKDEYVISAPINLVKQFAKDKEIYLDIKLNKTLENAKHILGAGPYLVKDSELYVDYKTQKLEAISGKNPRSAIGYKDDGTLIIVSVDGREQSSVGMTLFELGKFMLKLGCTNAMNFDGGSSSALYVKGKIVNSAYNKEGVAVSNALVINEVDSSLYQISSID